MNGADPLLLIHELSDLGTMIVIADLTALPPLEELNPHRCYVSWDIHLTTSAVIEVMRDVFIFVDDTCELVIEAVPPPQRSLHTRDGDRVSSATPAGAAEQRNSPARRDYDSATSIRVPPAKLDQFVDLIGELVTVQARLSEVANHRDDPDLIAVSEEVERLTSALRENSMSIRMLPIRGTFERFRRLVHDLSRDLHKDVELTIEGAETELDKTVIDQLNAPLDAPDSQQHGSRDRNTGTASCRRKAADGHGDTVCASLGCECADRCR
jgi:two-component system chemotaxis sensor kinase CheA